MATSEKITHAPRANASDRAPHFDNNARKLATAQQAVEAALAIADDITGASPSRGSGADLNPRTRETRHELFRRFPEEFKTGVKAGFTASGKYPDGFCQWLETRRNAWFAGWNVGRCDRLRGPEKGAAK